MFASQRTRGLRRIAWSSNPWRARYNDSITVLECWKYSRLDEPQEDVNYRRFSLIDAHHERGSSGDQTDDTMERWLNFEGVYSPPKPPPDAGEVEGGIRLLLVERNYMSDNVTISREIFESVERVFSLHPATLAAFEAVGGAFSYFLEQDSGSNAISRIRIVVKANQKTNVGNSTLSLCYDVSTGWTTGLVCGEFPNTDELTNAVIAMSQFWDNPLCLPCVLAEDYTMRIQVQNRMLNRKLTEQETALGVTKAGQAQLHCFSTRWPEDIETHEATISLHSISTQVSFMMACCKWVRSYTAFLSDLAQKLAADEALRQRRPQFERARESIRFWESVQAGVEAGVNMFKERANLQVNALFSIIGLQENILSRHDSKVNEAIAISNKQDSISVSTFTFITAFFLPGTFIATLFSMSMFDWRPDGTKSDKSYVSGNFWIFWVVVVPLTALTLIGWYHWSKYATAAWRKQLLLQTSMGKTGLTAAPATTDSYPGRGEKGSDAFKPGARLQSFYASNSWLPQQLQKHVKPETAATEQQASVSVQHDGRAR